MIGVVLVTHGRLAAEFRSALEHVVGPQAQLETVSIGPDDDASVRRGQIVDAIHRTDTGDGVIVKGSLKSPVRDGPWGNSDMSSLRGSAGMGRSSNTAR